MIFHRNKTKHFLPICDSLGNKHSNKCIFEVIKCQMKKIKNIQIEERDCNEKLNLKIHKNNQLNIDLKNSNKILNIITTKTPISTAILNNSLTTQTLINQNTKKNNKEIATLNLNSQHLNHYLNKTINVEEKELNNKFNEANKNNNLVTSILNLNTSQLTNNGINY